VGLTSVHHNQPMVNFDQFCILELKTKQNLTWKWMWIAIIWGVWKHMNNIILKNEKSDIYEIWCLSQLNAWSWMKHKILGVKFSYTNWYLCPIKCLKHWIIGYWDISFGCHGGSGYGRLSLKLGRTIRTHVS